MGGFLLNTSATDQQTISWRLTVVNLSNVKVTYLANDLKVEQLHPIRFWMTALQSAEMVGGMCSVIMARIVQLQQDYHMVRQGA